MNIKTLFENENFIAIDKPSGLVVHGDGKSDVYTLSDWILENYSDIGIENVGESIFLENGEEIKRPGIVHRLDKETSGVMIIAKNQESFLKLKEKFKNREVEKTYHAFVYGNVKEDELEIDKPIGRSSSNIRKWTSFEKDLRKDGKIRNALTHIKVLKRGVDKESEENITLVEAKPKTGRTHQIRVHLNFMGRPILCDKLYTKRDCLLGFNRVALHAKSISFKDLDSEETILIESEYPEDFKKSIESIELV